MVKNLKFDYIAKKYFLLLIYCKSDTMILIIKIIINIFNTKCMKLNNK